MKVEPIKAVYKSTFNTKPNPNKGQNKKDKKEKPAVIVEISDEARKKLEDDYER